MSIRHIQISDFDYPLSSDKIALHPLPERDSSKLLVWQDGRMSDTHFHQLAGHLPPNSLLVMNNARVIPARLMMQKPTGGVLEIFLLSPHELDLSEALGSESGVRWNCLIGGAKKWKQGAVSIVTEQGMLEAYLDDRSDDGFVVRFEWSPSTKCFAEMLEIAGNIPLPPYLNRATEDADKERYQTVFAQKQGSVAAPTAGLHFTNTLLKSLEQKGIKRTDLTLHVSAGTFKPVSADKMEGHQMHAEFIDVPKSTIETLMTHDGPVVPVGTTAMRTLESLFWIAGRIERNEPDLHVSQWDPYDYENTLTRKQALQVVMDYLNKWQRDTVFTATSIIIGPGYTHRMCDGLITNFHQPKSTLLLLIASITGNNWRTIYQHALENEYRFLSYGDACLFLM